jgi:hypothetical protein
MAFNISNMSLDELQTAVWNLYKDVHCVHPRHFTDEEWMDHALLENTLRGLLDNIARTSAFEEDCYESDAVPI